MSVAKKEISWQRSIHQEHLTILNIYIIIQFQNTWSKIYWIERENRDSDTTFIEVDWKSVIIVKTHNAIK